METLKNKKNPYISEDRNPKKLLIFQEMELLNPSSKNKKKKPYISGKKLSYSDIKKFLIFSQKNAFLIFREMETLKKFFIFEETELSYISGNKFQAQKMKKTHS